MASDISPPGALTDLQVRADTALGDAACEPPGIVANHREQRPVQDSGGKALVLAEFREHLGRRHHGDIIRQCFAKDRGRPPLVRWIGIGVYEADDHTVDILCAKCGCDDLELVFRQRQMNHTVRPHPLLHLEAQVSRHQGRRVVGMDIVNLGAGLTADLQEVAKAFGGHDGDRAAAPLDQGVGADGRAVMEAGDIGCAEPVLGQDVGDAVHDRPVRPVGRGGQLVSQQAALGGDADRDVGKGPADIDPDVNVRLTHGP